MSEGPKKAGVLGSPIAHSRSPQLHLAAYRALGLHDWTYERIECGAAELPVVVGYAGISRLGRTPPFEYEVHTIGVDPAYQGRGIGRRLLRELLDFARGGVVYLEVRTDNDAALALYRSVGFQRVGLRRRYYRVSGADAYTMRRDSGDPS